MKKTAWCAAVAMGLVFSAGAMAHEPILTAHVSAEGEVLRQRPNWISGVKKVQQDDYPTEFKLKFDNKAVKEAPRFCSVSTIDNATSAATLHGQGRILGEPLAESATVLTQLVDLNKASGDNSLAFLVMCVR